MAGNQKQSKQLLIKWEGFGYYSPKSSSSKSETSQRIAAADSATEKRRSLGWKEGGGGIPACPRPRLAEVAFPGGKGRGKFVGPLGIK